jgi:hypothetical protein
MNPTTIVLFCKNARPFLDQNRILKIKQKSPQKIKNFSLLFFKNGPTVFFLYMGKPVGLFL